MVPKKPSVTIIVCTKNNKKIISSCLDSVKKQTYKNWGCLVVDDGSTDGTVELVRRKYPFVKCLSLEGKGAAYNRNVAIKTTRGKYIVTLDSDAILAKYWLEKMFDLMEKNPRTGIAGGKILCADKPQLISAAGGGLTLVGTGLNRGAGQKKTDQRFNQTAKVLFVCSAAMIIRRQIFKITGLFDPDYVYGYEDLDLCWRANSSGFEVVYFPRAQAFHQMGATIKKFPSAQVRYLSCRNQILTLLKNCPTPGLVCYLPFFLAHFGYLLLSSPHRRVVLKAVWWNARNLKKTLKKRKKINTLRKDRSWHLSQKPFWLLVK